MYPTRGSNAHQGNVTLWGPRKSGRMCQPSVSEGPNEVDYWFHRAYAKHLYWPFLLFFMNFLLCTTSIAPYYFYPHMAKLFPINNDIDQHIRFCRNGLLTINFCCACHLDKNDCSVIQWTLEELVCRLQRLIELFNVLKRDGLYYLQLRSKQALQSLKHLLWWGVSLPTTCCYQYVRSNELSDVKIDIYQWFLCPGLGTSHRITNYWVHIMLAGLFQHSTSSAIYIVDGCAFFGECPHVTMFAWGSS